jgi:hypothetical protein
MSLWDDDIYNLGDRVKVLVIGSVTGIIQNIRRDSSGDPIITVLLDDASVTPDGLYIARDFELGRDRCGMDRTRQRQARRA